MFRFCRRHWTMNQSNIPFSWALPFIHTTIFQYLTLCVCLCVCVYVCHDVCPDDLTMKDWRHTNNSLRVYSWGCLAEQIMFHALVASSMTSPGHKVSQILKLLHLRQYLARRSIKSSKYHKCSWLSCWHIQLLVSLPVKRLSRPQNDGHFEIF